MPEKQNINFSWPYKANFFPSIVVGDVCGGKKKDLKTVVPRNVIGCVVRYYRLGWGLLIVLLTCTPS